MFLAIDLFCFRTTILNAEDLLTTTPAKAPKSWNITSKKHPMSIKKALQISSGLYRNYRVCTKFLRLITLWEINIIGQELHFPTFYTVSQPFWFLFLYCSWITQVGERNSPAVIRSVFLNQYTPEPFTYRGGEKGKRDHQLGNKGSSDHQLR